MDLTNWNDSIKTTSCGKRLLEAKCEDCNEMVYDTPHRIRNNMRKNQLCKPCNKRRYMKGRNSRLKTLEAENKALREAILYYALGNEDSGEMARVVSGEWF